MNVTASTYYYPNQMGRIILLALEEIIGRGGTEAMLKQARLPELVDNYPPDDKNRQVPFETVSRLQSALEEAYGTRAGRGIALRVGRACFHYGLHEFGALTGATDLAFRLLPLSAKLKVGSRSFAEVFNRYSDQQVQLEQDRDHIYWNIERCPVCWTRRSDEPVCHLAVGLLQEALYWASGGRFFNVEETRCAARGDPCCTIVIDKAPLG